MRERQQSTTTYPLAFFLADSADHVSGKTGLAPTVTLSKNGAAFGAAFGAVSEIGNGWYGLAGNATDRNTLGSLLLHASAAGADPYDGVYTIVGYDPFDVNLGLARLDAAVSTRSSHTAADVWAAATRTLSAFAFSVTVGTNNDKTGYALSGAGVQAIWDALTTALLTVGSVGKRIADLLDVSISSRAAIADYTAVRAGKLDQLDAAISSRSSHTAADVWAVGARTLTAFGFAVDLSAGSIAAIWDRASSALSVAGSIGKLLVDMLDSAISSRLASSSYTAPDNASIATIAGRVDVATSSRLPTASYVAPDNAGISAIAGYVDTEIAAIAAAVDALPSSIPSSATIASAVWDALTANHLEDGSTGEALSTAAEASVGALAYIGAAQIETVAPVSRDGAALTLISGNDYALADGRALLWTDAGGEWPDLTGATIVLVLSDYADTVQLEAVGSVVTPSGANKTVRVELDNSETESLAIARTGRFHVDAILAGSAHLVTLIRGRLIVQARPHAEP